MNIFKPIIILTLSISSFLTQASDLTEKCELDSDIARIAVVARDKGTSLERVLYQIEANNEMDGMEDRTPRHQAIATLAYGQYKYKDKDTYALMATSWCLQD